MTFDELKSIVETSWRVACEADLKDCGPMHICKFMQPYPDGTKQEINSLNSVRLQVFYQCMSTLMPKEISSSASVELKESKEPWQR